MSITIKRVLFLFGAVSFYAATFAQLAPGFGTGGRLSLSADGFDQPSDIVAAPGDTLYVLGWSGHVDSLWFDASVTVAKLTPEGNQIPSFGTGGWVSFDFEGMQYCTARSLHLQPDGKLLVMGAGSTFANPDYSPVCVARLHPDGRVDSAFGTNGTVWIEFYKQQEYPGEFTSDAAGGIWITGGSWDTLGSHNVPVAGHFSSTLTADSAFGGTGKLVLDFQGGLLPLKAQHLTGGEAYDIIPLPDGGMITCGSFGAQAFVARLTQAGILDSSFAGTGCFLFQADLFYNNRAQCMTLLPDSSILVAVNVDNPLARDYHLIRLSLADGSTLDFTEVNFSDHNDLVTDIQVLPNGKVVVLGQTKDKIHLTAPAWIADYFSLLEISDYHQLDVQEKNLLVFDSLYQGGGTAMAMLSNGQLILEGFAHTGTAGEADIALMALDSSALTIGVGEEASEELVMMFPNPAVREQSLTILWNQMHYPVQISLLDYTGRTLIQKVVQHDNHFCLPLNQIPSGVYIAEWRHEGKAVRKKIVIAD